MKTKRNVMTLILTIILAVSLLCPAAVFADTTVYTTETGTKYHSTSTCSGLSTAKKVYTDTESSAISRGLTKCSKCWNGSSSSSSSSSSSTTTSSITTTTTTKVSTAATAKIALKAKAKKVKVGKKLKIKLTNNKSKVKWTLSNKRAKITKKTNSYVVIKGKKKGNVVLKAKAGGKTYKIKIKVVK